MTTWEQYKEENKNFKGSESALRRSFELENTLDAIPDPTVKFRPWGRIKASKAAMMISRN